MQYTGFSQNWVEVGAGFDGDPRCTFVDTVSDLLYVGGTFKSSGSIRMRGIAKWDGSQWDSLQSGIDDFNLSYPDPINAIIKFQNKIYVGGSFATAGGITVNGLGIWDGSQWDSLASGISAQATVDCFKVLNGELYVGGTFNNVGGITSHHIAKWDGSNWNGFNFGIDSTFGGVFTIEEFNGDLYVGGNILPASIRDLFVWDGSTVSPVGSGIQGGLASISKMIVYNNELYIAGYFTQADGNAGNCIIKYDGNTLIDVGGGMDNRITDLKVHDGLLYACGVFNHAGGISANKIAVWNGVSWSALSNDLFDNNIEAMDFYHNELYVVGGFTKINNDSVNFIAKYTGQLGISDLSKRSGFTITPNPTNTQFTMSFSIPLAKDAMLVMMDSRGKEVARTLLEKSTNRKELDVHDFSTGIYFLILQTEIECLTGKLIIE